jgi:nitrogen-specific signal transduction histidine kinase
MRSYSIGRMMKKLSNCSLMIEVNDEGPGVSPVVWKLSVFLTRDKAGNLL